MKVPIWKYHQELCPDGKIVRCENELDSLGKDWVDSPAEFDHEKISQCAQPENYHEHMENWPEKVEAKPQAKAKKAKAK